MGARRLALPVASQGTPSAPRKTSAMSQPTTDSPTSAAKSAQAPVSPRPNAVIRFFKRLFVSIFLLALAALIFFLLSERNARLFKLELNESGALTVMRGRHLPVGFAPWTPQDLQLAETYAPFVLDQAARAGLDLNRVYEERDALDRALFDMHREAIEQRAGQSDAATLEEVVRLLRRAERLPGLSDEQKRQLRDLQIRTAYFEGRQRLREAENAWKNRLGAAVHTLYGDGSLIQANKYDLILANINRNILLQDMDTYYRGMRSGSVLVLSGFYTDDIPVLEARAVECGFRMAMTRDIDNWASIILFKE